MKEEKRIYHMSNADLTQLAIDFGSFITRDAVQFNNRGVKAADITAFKDLADDFEIFPTDDDYVGQITIKVTAKNLHRITVINHIQYVSGFIEQKWGINSGQYRRLGIKNIQTMADRKLVIRTREVARISEEYLDDLTPLGLLQGDIDQLNIKANTYEILLTEISDAKALRDEKARERTNKGNELYSYVTKYSIIGKLIWENINTAYYNDYIIYSKKPGVPGKIDNLMYNLQTNLVSWRAEPIAETYELEYKMDVPEGIWLTAYKGNLISTIHNPGIGEWIYRCRGINSKGNGTWSNEINVIINPL